MFHVEQKPSEEIARDGSREKLEFFERAGPFGLWFHFPGQGSRILRARRPRHATHMKQARATRLFHVEQSCGSSLFHVSSVPWTPCPQDPRALPGEVKPQPERPRSFEEFQLLTRTVPGDFLTRLLFHVKHLASEAVLC